MYVAVSDVFHVSLKSTLKFKNVILLFLMRNKSPKWILAENKWTYFSAKKESRFFSNVIVKLIFLH